MHNRPFSLQQQAHLYNNIELRSYILTQYYYKGEYQKAVVYDLAVTYSRYKAVNVYIYKRVKKIFTKE